jgi:hypothetical protein
MASVYDKYYEQQPAVVKVIVVAGLGLAGYAIYRHFKKAQDIKDANQASALAQGEINTLEQQGVTQSFDDSQYEAFCQRLVQAMNGCGTDEQSVYDVFRQLRNNVDIRKLIVQFGVRYYQPCAATSPISYLIWQANDKAYGGGLPTWLSYDLSSSEIANINGILASAGISYQF